MALVQRRGREAGWHDLAASAAEQDAALRALISGRADAPSGQADLAAALRTAGSERVTVSVPAEPVVLDARCTAEIAAAVHAALDNVVRHAGPGARAWVLLDRLDDAVEVTVRDDGCGMAAGRLAAAAGQGRLGVSRSIRGRVTDLGGDIDIDSRKDDGTTVRIRVPVGPA